MSDQIDMSLIDLFLIEVENHSRSIETGIVELEADATPQKIESLMRAAHSIKGAARIIGLDSAVGLAHIMEDVFSSAKKGEIVLNSEIIDILLKSNDIFKEMLLVQPEKIPSYFEKNSDILNNLKQSLKDILTKNYTKEEKKIDIPEKNAIATKSQIEEIKETEQTNLIPSEKATEKFKDTNSLEISQKDIAAEKQEESFVRVLSENLNKMMGLAGECLVQVKSLNEFSKNHQRMKAIIFEIDRIRDKILNNLKEDAFTPEVFGRINETSSKLEQLRFVLNQHIEDFENFSRRLEQLTDKLYNEAIATRMRPFSEGLHGFPRMVRDLAKSLGKKINFSIEGASTHVDRDILEKLEAPLTHLIRNAIDHGIELPEERILKNKNPEGKVVLEARHRSGMLIITLRDDGRGISEDMLRKKIVEKGYTSSDVVENMSNNELLEFLFLPGFSTASNVTEISGRGVGLDVVFSMVSEVGGTVRVESQDGEGTTFQLQLPLTLSVLRTMLVEVNNEIYAFPLSRIDRILKIRSEDLKIIEERQYVSFDNENIGIIKANQAFNLPQISTNNDINNIVVISDRLNRYGLVIDKFIGEKSLVVIPLDKRLGKIPNISSGAILEDGTPVLILDVDDVVRSIDKLLGYERINKIFSSDKALSKKQKKILVVDDSLTVREVERRLLENKGYYVELAVDGIDGWNILQKQNTKEGIFDLVITDIDMPRMNGIELVTKMKSDEKFRSIPVMIVSYKDREEDKIKGLEAGANYYLTKSSFHDESLLNAVKDLIGEP